MVSAGQTSVGGRAHPLVTLPGRLVGSRPQGFMCDAKSRHGTRRGGRIWFYHEEIWYNLSVQNRGYVFQAYEAARRPQRRDAKGRFASRFIRPPLGVCKVLAKKNLAVFDYDSNKGVIYFELTEAGFDLCEWMETYMPVIIREERHRWTLAKSL